MDAAIDSVWAVSKDRVTAQQGVPFLQTCRGGLRYIILKARVWLLSTPPTGQQARPGRAGESSRCDDDDV